MPRWPCSLFLLAIAINSVYLNELSTSHHYKSLVEPVAGEFSKWYNETVNFKTPFNIEFHHNYSQVRADVGNALFKLVNILQYN